MQEIKRREDAAARGIFNFPVQLQLKETMTAVCIADFPFTYSVSSFFCFAAGIVLEEKNWPPFFPIIHHDIANEIPIHLQRVQYVAFTTYLGMLAKISISWLLVSVF